MALDIPRPRRGARKSWAGGKRPPTAMGLSRTDYWHFLREAYGMGALEAWNYVKRMGPPPSADQIRGHLATEAAHG